MEQVGQEYDEKEADENENDDGTASIINLGWDEDNVLENDGISSDQTTVIGR